MWYGGRNSAPHSTIPAAAASAGCSPPPAVAGAGGTVRKTPHRPNPIIVTATRNATRPSRNQPSSASSSNDHATTLTPSMTRRNQRSTTCRAFQLESHGA